MNLSKTQRIYLGDLPLESGVDYFVIVETDTGVSSPDMTVPSSGKFRLLDPHTAIGVQAEIDRAHQEGVGDKPTLAVVDVMFLRTTI